MPLKTAALKEVELAAYIAGYPFALTDQYPDFRPSVWGFHAWTDVNRYLITSNDASPNRSAPATHWVDTAIANWAAYQGIAMPTLWNTETGSNYKLACKTSQGKDTAVTRLCAWNTGPGMKLDWPNAGNSTYFFMMPVQAKGAGFALQLANVDPSHIQALIYYRYSDRGGTSEPDLFAPPDDPFGPNSDFSAPGQRRPVYCVIRDRITVDDPRLPPSVGC